MKNPDHISSGNLLISEPFMQGDYFQRSVILLIDHHIDGSFGVIINKPTIFGVNDIVEISTANDIYLRQGGPVESDLLFFIHSFNQGIEGGMPISSQLSWGGNYNQVVHLMKNHVLHKNNVWFFLGYSGWAPGQLEQEIQEGSWVILETPLFEFMQNNPSKMWEKALMTLGDPYKKWINYPLNPMLN